MASEEKTSVAVAVVGSRSFSDYGLLCERLSDIPIGRLVSGGAAGADSLVEQYAKDNGIDILVIKPDWQRHGRGAGFIRNKIIVDTSDMVVAFWDGASRGTKDSMDHAEKTGKRLVVIKYKEKEIGDGNKPDKELA